MGLLSKSKKDYEVLVRENEELKEKLNRALELNNSLEDLEFKVISARKSIADLNQKEFESGDKLRSTDSEIQNKDKILEKLKNEIKSLETNKSGLTKTINDYNGKIAEQKNLLENKIAQLKEIDGKEIETASLYIEKQTEIDELNKSVLALYTDKEYLEKEIISLQDNIHALREENRDIDNNYGTIKAEYNLLKEQTEEFKTRLSSYNKELRETEILVVRSRDNEAKLKTSIDELESEEIKKSESVKELDNKILISEEIKQSIEEALSGLIKQLAEKDALYDEYLIRRDDLATQIIDKRKELANLELQISQKGEELKNIGSETENQTSELLAIKAEYDGYSPKINEIRQSILMIKQEEELLLQKLAELKSVISETENYKNQTEQNYLHVEAKLAETLESFNTTIVETKQKLNSIKQQVLEKEIESNTKEKILNEKRTLIAESEGKLKVLELEKKTLENIVVNLKSAKTEKEETIERLKEKEFSVKTSLTNAKSELSIIETGKTELETNFKHIADIQLKNIGEYLAKRELLQNELKETEEQHTVLETSLDTKKAELAKAQAELGDLKIQIEEYSGKAARLISMVKNETKQE